MPRPGLGRRCHWPHGISICYCSITSRLWRMLLRRNHRLLSRSWTRRLRIPSVKPCEMMAMPRLTSSNALKACHMHGQRIKLHLEFSEAACEAEEAEKALKASNEMMSSHLQESFEPPSMLTDQWMQWCFHQSCMVQLNGHRGSGEYRPFVASGYSSSVRRKRLQGHCTSRLSWHTSLESWANIIPCVC